MSQKILITDRTLLDKILLELKDHQPLVSSTNYPIEKYVFEDVLIIFKNKLSDKFVRGMWFDKIFSHPSTYNDNLKILSSLFFINKDLEVVLKV